MKIRRTFDLTQDHLDKLEIIRAEMGLRSIVEAMRKLIDRHQTARPGLPYREESK